MRSKGFAGLVAVLALAGALGGCGSNDDSSLPRYKPSSGASPSASTSSGVPVFQAPAKGAVIGDVLLPEPAAAQDDKGAEQFGVWFLTVLEYAPREPGPETIAAASDACVPCEDALKIWKREKAQNIRGRFARPVRFQGVFGPVRHLNGGSTVSIKVDEPRYQLVKRHKVTKSFPAHKDREYTLTLKWHEGSWSVQNIAILDAGA